MYEDLTEHLGFLRSSDEYKVMALASYGEPRFAELGEAIYSTGDGGFRTDASSGARWSRRAPPKSPGPRTTPTSRPASSGGWRTCCSTSPVGSTAAPGPRS
jgi:carbamoyltransferase